MLLISDLTFEGKTSRMKSELQLLTSQRDFTFE